MLLVEGFDPTREVCIDPDGLFRAGRVDEEGRRQLLNAQSPVSEPTLSLPPTLTTETSRGRFTAPEKLIRRRRGLPSAIEREALVGRPGATLEDVLNMIVVDGSVRRALASWHPQDQRGPIGGGRVT